MRRFIYGPYYGPVMLFAYLVRAFAHYGTCQYMESTMLFLIGDKNFAHFKKLTRLNNPPALTPITA